MIKETKFFNLCFSTDLGDRKLNLNLERDGLQQVIPAQDTLLE